MEQHLQLFESFIKKVEREGNVLIYRNKTNGQDFLISNTKSNGHKGFKIETILNSDPILEHEIFRFVIQELFQAENHCLRRGNAQRKGIRIGHPGLEENTLESKIAIKFRGKKEGDSTTRRITAVANILVTSEICSHAKGELCLRQLK